MFKPLLRTLPSMSGNVKLVCLLDDIRVKENDKIARHNYECNIRHARLAPLSSSMYTRYLPVSLLNSSYEWDLSSFYHFYSDFFWEVIYNFNKYDLPKFDRYSINPTRNTDFEYGCKRLSYQKQGYQFGFFAPIYIEDISDIPDIFRIEISLNNGINKTVKYVDINFGSNTGSDNYLYQYIERYAKQITDDVIFLNPNSLNANYFGIDVRKGGFVTYTDNIISKLYLKQNTIQNFDNVICTGFKRNNIVIKQVLPLCFYFNINDLFNEYELDKYINSIANISGCWIKDNEAISFCDWDTEYSNYVLPIKLLDSDTCEMVERYNLNSDSSTFNIMNTGFPSLNEGIYKNYRLSNVLYKNFARWKLKFSSDNNPYIINCSPAFSMNQNSNSNYGEYPNFYNFISGRVKQIKVKNGLDNLNYLNLILPVKSNVDTQYDNNGLYSVIEYEKYNKIRNNFVSEWFNIINNDETVEDILSNYFEDVVNNMTLFKGVLYNFNNIYKIESNFNEQIDKFAVFIKLNYNPITDENIKNIKTSDYTIVRYYENISKYNTFINYSFIFNNDNADIFNIDNVINQELTNDYIKSDQIICDDIFTKLYNEDGNFINLLNYGINYYDINKYFRKNEIDLLLKNDDFITNELTSFITNFLYKFKINRNSNIVNIVTNSEIRNEIYSILNNEVKYYELYKLLPIYNIFNIIYNYKYNNKILLSFINKRYDNTNAEYVHTGSHLAHMYMFDRLMLYYSTNDDYNKVKIQNYNKILDIIDVKSNSENTNLMIYQLLAFYSKSSILDIINNLLDAIVEIIMIKTNNLQIDKTSLDYINYIDYIKLKIYNNICNNYNITPYIWTVEKQNNRGEVIAKNCVEEFQEFPGKNYGDLLDYDNSISDKDFIYVDPYNCNQIISEYNIKNNINCSYICDDGYIKYISKNIILDNYNSTDYYCLFFNKNHFTLYFSKFFNNANCNKDQTFGFNKFSIFDSIFIRKKVSLLKIQENLDTENIDIHVQDMFIPLREYFIIDENSDYADTVDSVITTLDLVSVESSTAENNLYYFNKYTSINDYIINSKKSKVSEKVRKAIIYDTLKLYLKFNFNEVIDDTWFDTIDITNDFGELITTQYKLKEDKYKYIINNNYLDPNLCDILYNIDVIDKDYEKYFAFNICFKKKFIRLNNELMDIINIEGHKSKYMDLFLYKLESDQDYVDSNLHLKIYDLDVNENLEKVVKYNENYLSKNNICLRALYNSIYKETKENSKICCEYNVNNVQTVNIVNNTHYTNITEFYRHNSNNILCLYDIKIDKDNYNEQLAYCSYSYLLSILNINGINYYSKDDYDEYYSCYSNLNNVINMINIDSSYSYLLSYYIMKPVYDSEDIEMSSKHYCEINYDYANNVTYTLCNSERLNIIYSKGFTYIVDNNINIYEIGDYQYGYLFETFDRFIDVNAKLDLCYKYNNTNNDNNDNLVENKYTYNEYISRNYTYYDKETFDRLHIGEIMSYEKIYNNELLTYIYAAYTESITQLTTSVTYNIANKLNINDNNIFDDLKLYDKYKINTYKSVYEDENGEEHITTYGFYCLNLNFDNTIKSISLLTGENYTSKYIAYINGKKINTLNNIYMKNMFRMIVPFIKIDLFKELLRQDEQKIINKPNKLTLPVNYRSKIFDNKLYIKEDNKNVKYSYSDIYFTKNSKNERIVLHRYLSAIKPLLTKVNNITLSSLKYKTVDKAFNFMDTINEIYFNTIESINKYPGLRIYNLGDITDDNLYFENINNKDVVVGIFDIVKDYEYKYFNDNKFYNLEEEIIIEHEDFLNYTELLFKQTEEETLKIFKNYIFYHTGISFNDDEMLFLYKKYSKQYLTNTDELFLDKKTKRYKLTYKFNLL